MPDSQITADDIEAIRVCAKQLKKRSADEYGGTGLQADRMRADKALAVADKLETRLAVRI